jgi:hypothetical protein
VSQARLCTCNDLRGGKRKRGKAGERRQKKERKGWRERERE